MAGLSQLELDTLCVEADDDGQRASSPQGTFLRRRRRQVPLSAMGAEITALEDSANDRSSRPGLSQKELDKLASEGEDSGIHCGSPMSSSLYRAKRFALQVSEACRPHSVASTYPGLGVGSPVGLSQVQLDAMCDGNGKTDASAASKEAWTTHQDCAGLSLHEDDTKLFTVGDVPSPLCRSPAGSKKRSRRIPTRENLNWSLHADEKTTPSRANSKELSQASPKDPRSPLQQRKCQSEPLSPLKWQAN